MAPLNELEPSADFEAALNEIVALAIERHRGTADQPAVAPAEAIRHAVANIPASLPDNGFGLKGSLKVLLEDVVPALNSGQTGSRYYGFVTGGTLPSSVLADFLVTLFDQNVQVHLPRETVSTLIEEHALSLSISLLSLPYSRWTGTITTGATGSNILALACGREVVTQRAMQARGHTDWSAAEDGLVDAAPVTIHVALPHASIKKAAAIVGIGRARVKDVGRKVAQVGGDDEALARARAAVLDFDLEGLEHHLQAARTKKEGSIIVIGMGEVNTGALSAQIPALRALADEYGAWLHVDAAFAAFACLLPGFGWVSEHLNMADSITSDAHKQLNVPYDCGLFYIRRTVSTVLTHESPLTDVCGTGRGEKPAYLIGGASSSSTQETSEARSDEQARQTFAASLPSPLFRNLENSRRFRALPLYAALLSQGREGITSIVQRNVNFARRLEAWLRSRPDLYTVLTPQCEPLSNAGAIKPWTGSCGYSIVLFSAAKTCPRPEFADAGGAARLAEAIKLDARMYVSATSWCGVGAVRCAVSNWATGLPDEDPSQEQDKDFKLVTAALLDVMNPDK